jgi:hypothetical protein
MEFFYRNNHKDFDSLNVIKSYNNGCLRPEVPQSRRRSNSTSDLVVTKKVKQTMH